MSTEQFDDLEGAAQGPSRRTTLKGIAAALGAVALASPLAAAAQDVDADKKKRCRRGYPGPAGAEGDVGPKGPVGVYIAGPTGPTASGAITSGATGFAGPAGPGVGPKLSRVDSASVTVSPGGTELITVACPAGSYIMSYGFNKGNEFVQLTGAFISTTSNFARLAFTNPGTNLATAVQAHALCGTSAVGTAARSAGKDKGKGKGRGKAASKRGRNDNKKK